MENPSTPGEPTVYTWLITLQYPTRHGFGAVTDTGQFETDPGEPASRADAYREVRRVMARRYPEATGGNVLFFSIEPDRL